MFKKLKDKLAEEVKSSPQRIQQFAQAAQAAVTSASSSISDITNSDLFSIGDSDVQNIRATRSHHSPSKQQTTYQDSTLGQTTMDPIDHSFGRDEDKRQRKLSNSSFASDVSFRLPSYDSPSMYHLQSDMEVSASEAEERVVSGSNVSLERVTKEQLYSAYRRTQEKYTKYRTQYGDLARHYKLLEKENAKAKSVLVETQDKALRRISELREQCTLEQSAKAHLENALRVEIEDKDIKLELITKKIKVLQNNTSDKNIQDISDKVPYEVDCEMQLINFPNENDPNIHKTDLPISEISSLNNKIEKMEQLINKYKESLKASKDRNTEIVNNLQMLTNELINKNQEIDNLKATVLEISVENNTIQELKNKNEELQNTVNAFDFTKSKTVSTLELDLQKAKDEIEELQNKIVIFGKREEDYAISLAENKLSIHKELENKEAEIKSLKDSLSTAKKEMQSLNIVIDDYKSSLTTYEEEKTKMNTVVKEFKVAKSKISDLESLLLEATKKISKLEHANSKLEEDYNCLQLQLKQETAEKLAMIDRNVYLENRNSQISEENTKKSSQISSLENELVTFREDTTSKDTNTLALKNNEILAELNVWKAKYENLELEIQDERVELVKLQTEIEKLLVNHELIQSQNTEFHNLTSDLKNENKKLLEQVSQYDIIKKTCHKFLTETVSLKHLVKSVFEEATLLQRNNHDAFKTINKQIEDTINQVTCKEIKCMKTKQHELSLLNSSLQTEIMAASKQNEGLMSSISAIQEENNLLICSNKNLESQITALNKNISLLDNEYKALQQYVRDLEEIRLEKDNLNSIIKDNESKLKNLEVLLESEQTKQKDLITQIHLLKDENENLLQKVNCIEKANLNLKLKLQNESDNCKKKLEDIVNSTNVINKQLGDQTEELENKMNLVNQLTENVKLLTNKNSNLEMQVQNSASHLIHLESGIHDAKTLYEAVVIEKDRLKSVIELLQQENSKNDKDTKITQTDIENKIISDATETLKLSKQNSLQESQTETNTYINICEENKFCNECVLLKSDYDVLKDENRRLQSDIEGLQTYLTKISKENSILNDKLRDLIATSDHATEDEVINNLQNEVQTGKEKVESILRENALLVEENLELKDQLQDHNYTNLTKTLNVNENVGHMCNEKERYKILLQNNNELEQRLHDSEHMNKSANMSMQHMQEKNDKLRSSNEKLERRLDEALVSLRHLHSLQENTELEYLRNILYEYLTGSGTHSVTLAKVLSAIVKFDDSQTQLVLQKEKERQGLLRQLGLI